MGPAVQGDRGASGNGVLSAVCTLNPERGTGGVSCIANLEPQILGSTIANAGIRREIKHPGVIRETGGIHPALDRQIPTNHRGGRYLVPALRQSQRSATQIKRCRPGERLPQRQGLTPISEGGGLTLLLHILNAAVLREVVVVAAHIIRGRLPGRAHRITGGQPSG